MNSRPLHPTGVGAFPPAQKEKGYVSKDVTPHSTVSLSRRTGSSLSPGCLPDELQPLFTREVLRLHDIIAGH